MKLKPAWFLFLVAPMTAEYVSGSSPYLNPFVWLANFLLYGVGALLIRDCRARWGKGWRSVFILSAAYMIAEEGLMLNTLFDPTKNADGRFLGVNWVWTAGMLVVHSLVSIFAPIMLAESLYPAEAKRVWLSGRDRWLLLAAFAANVFGLGRLIAPYHRPPLIYSAVELAIIALGYWLAKSLPFSGEWRQPRSPRRLFLVSSVGTLATFLINFAVPATAWPAVLKIVLMLGAYCGFLAVLRRNGAFEPGLPAISGFAVACGIISFWIVFSPLGSIAKHTPGPVIFGAGMGVFLWRQRRRLISTAIS